jgi:hypothetical protein
MPEASRPFESGFQLYWGMVRVKPRLLILWREQHPEAEYQLPLPFEPEQSAGELVRLNARFNPKVVELDL